MKLRRPTGSSLSLILLSVAALAPAPAAAHAERQSFFPQARVSAAPAYRPMLPGPQTPRLVVCKKPDDEGVQPGEDSASRIAAIQDAALRSVNNQLLQECAFEHLQAAVDTVSQRGTTIYLLPGVYREQPSVRALEENFGAAVPGDKAYCQALLLSGSGAFSYEEQFRCRHVINLVAVFGDRNFTDDDCGTNTEGVCGNPATVGCNPDVSACPYNDLQIEGTGERNTDTVLRGGYDGEGHFQSEVALRADRADGIYLRNFTTEVFEEFGPYALETDGYVFDRMLGRFVDEYSFLTFASDHGRFVDCEGYGAGDSVLYPGSAANLFGGLPHSARDQRQRQSVEIVNSSGHHSAAGYSGTAGDSVWVHDTRFYKNVTGLVTDSLYANHPGMPQSHGLYENNLIYRNNIPYHDYVETDGPCSASVSPRDSGRVPAEIFTGEFDRLPAEVREAVLDRMVVCPTIPSPLGTGFIIAGGNHDVVRGNQVFDNWKQGFMLLHVPAALRDNSDPDKQFDTSHYVRYLENRFAEDVLSTPARLQPNTFDFWFDDSGIGNCWARNTSAAPGGVTEDTSNPLGLGSEDDKECPDGPVPGPEEQQASHNEARIAFLSPCALYSRDDPDTKDGCSFFDPLVAPSGREGSPQAIASQPPDAVVHFGHSGKAGYFVLDNDSGDAHELAGVTLASTGPVETLAGLTLSVTLPQSGQIVTRSVELTSLAAGSNVFTFDQPVILPPVHYVLFELHAQAPSVVALTSGPALLASGAAGAFGLGVVLLAGAARRRFLLLVMALTAAGTFTSCSSSTPLGGGPIEFTLQSLDIPSPDGVNYAGLPLKIGAVSIQQ